jgi:hypothetical protein
VISTGLFVTCVVVLLRGNQPARQPRGSEGAAARALAAAPANDAGPQPAAPTSSATLVTLPREGLLPPTPPAERAGAVRFMGLLDNVSDYDDVAQNQAYATLASWVQRLSEDEAARIRRDDLDYEALVKTPAPLRGELVQVKGLLVRFEAVRLVPGAGPPDVDSTWRGWLVDTSGDECYIFDTLAAPPAVEQRRDIISVEGAFLKVLRYENQAGETRDAPFLLARRVAQVQEEELQAMKRSLETPRYVILLLGLAGIALFVLVARQFRGAGGRGSLMSHHAELDSMRARLREKRSNKA